MAREPNTQQTDEPKRRPADQSSTNPNTSRPADAASDQTDRERSIRTGREAGRSSGVARPSTTPPVYGTSFGSLANPFAMMRRMAEDMDRMFGNFGLGRAGLGPSPFFDADIDRDLWRRGSNLQQSSWTPQVETFRRGDQLVVRADLPGMKKEDVNVEVDDGVLTISGERYDEHEENRDDSYRSERTYGQFYRAIPLPEGVSDQQCDASFKDGVLEVTLPMPKEPDRKAKKIPVR